MTTATAVGAVNGKIATAAVLATATVDETAVLATATVGETAAVLATATVDETTKFFPFLSSASGAWRWRWGRQGRHGGFLCEPYWRWFCSEGYGILPRIQVADLDPSRGPAPAPSPLASACYLTGSPSALQSPWIADEKKESQQDALYNGPNN